MEIKTDHTTGSLPVPDDEIVVRIRRRKRRPEWSLTRCVPWAVKAVFGDPAMVLIPAFALAAMMLVTFALGAPARAEAIVPLIVPPPSDSFQDIGIVALGGHAGAAAWVARALLATARTAFFALLVTMAAQRAAGLPVSVADAVRSVRGRAGTFAALGALSFGFALLVSQQSLLDPARDDAVAATAMGVGTLVLIGAFAAAAVRGRGPFRSLGHGIAFPRPIGHVVLVAGYSAAVNGLYRLASFGEGPRASALPLSLYALVAAFTTAVFAAAVTRRYRLLRSA